MKLVSVALPIAFTMAAIAAPITQEQTAHNVDSTKWSEADIVPVSWIPTAPKMYPYFPGILESKVAFKSERDLSESASLLDSRSFDEISPLERRIIINGVDRTNKKPGLLARILTKWIYKKTGWKKN